MKIPEKLHMSNLPTPLQEVSFEGIKFLIKRDDFTGFEYSGNKIRKLDYLLCEAIKLRADYVLTCGGDQSNHARATAVAALSNGIKPILYLWGKNNDHAEGNLFINKFVNAGLRFLTKREYDVVNDILAEEKRRYEKRGKRVYIIPEGGSNTLGIWGYINFIEELKTQCNISRIRKIYVAAGSGGTAAGLLIGIMLNNLKIKVCAVNVLYSEKEIRNRILNLAEGCSLDYKLGVNIDEGLLEIISGYSEEGYKKIESSKLKLIKKFAQSTGILLDPAYTGKAFNAFYDQVIKRKEKECLFIHTGGFFGIFSKRKDYLGI